MSLLYHIGAGQSVNNDTMLSDSRKTVGFSYCITSGGGRKGGASWKRRRFLDFSQWFDYNNIIMVETV